jgi:glycosyltransferase involved in cell wall biosynthesis
MRILIISILYRPEPAGKPFELAEGLARRGHAVEVLTGFPNYPYGSFYRGTRVRPWHVEWINGVRVVRLPLVPDRTRVALAGTATESRKAWRFTARIARALYRILNYVSFSIAVVLEGWWLTGKPDVVYVWGNPPTVGVAGLILSRAFRAKFVYGVHDLWPNLAVEAGTVKPGLMARIIGRIEDYVVRHADHVISISKGFRDELTKRGGEAGRFSVIPHWADETIYKPVDRDGVLARDIGAEGRFVVLFAGNIGRVQALDELLDAAKRLLETAPDVFVVLLGDGVNRPHLKKIAEEANLTNVRFLDPEPPENVARYAGIADVLYVGLVPGFLARLSIPSKVVSYMACGKPILSTVAGETAEMIAQAGAGITCEPEGGAIMRSILQLRDAGEEERMRMGASAHRVFLDQFSRERLLGEHEAVMDAVAGETRVPVLRET